MTNLTNILATQTTDAFKCFMHKETEPSPALHNPAIFVDDKKEVKEVGSPLLLSLLKRI
ncbi:hypothetical protein [Paraburkholderia fungorum]|jgi:hypothetical protein|uniref:hypothetical protein n=1 Tax=Paraburkholderia fungorum TaxID=134537 RepID=UPI000D44C67F|nr:hypothetical protein [Paraburkholderia fungorum]PRZ45395.1 hypothetical protein BX589_13974 [Paraburkholderia fungorum]